MARVGTLAFRYRARLLVLAALGGYFGLVAALGGRYTGWQRVGVPASTLRFADLRNVTGAWECARRGVAVVPINPCDPGRRPADFPQVWLLARHLGLGPGDTFPLGIAQGAVFLLAAVLVLPRGASLRAGALYALAVCSPAVMLGVERANPDLALFPVVLAAAVVAGRRGGGLALSALLVFVAAVLKLFPIFASGLLLRRGTRAAIGAGLATCAAFAVYGLATYSYLHRMLNAIPPSNSFSYGVRRASEWFGTAAQDSIGTLGWFRVWDVAIVCVAVATGWLLSRRVWPYVGAASSESTRELDLFWAGACIYVGSYPIFLSNDYRLIFCLLTLPQLWRWATEGRLLAGLTIAAVLLILWLDEWTGMPGVHVVLDGWNRTTAVGSGAFPLPVVVIAQWVVFSTFVGWLLGTQQLVRGRVLDALRFTAAPTP